VKTLYFQQFGSAWADADPLETITKRRAAVIEKLSALPGVDLEAGDIRALSWPDGIQYRVDFWVHNKPKTVSWDDIYSAVNSVYPVPYKFIPKRMI
jgi:hypothetical protein